ncbi:MAG: 3-oxoacyl-(acyl-carrier-protein) reductase [Anaerocolumna sp.]|jgi:3-oxoacyl-[acyl-carrier protein] reductase|nr:3-oxoacyl-(acyl-carrier-protein) reductase [Anaerocolumna sp.]
MSLLGKNVIITGGTGGIGQAAVELLFLKGANVFFTYNSSSDNVRELEGLKQYQNGIIAGYKVDIKNYSEVDNFIHEMAKNNRRIDVIINNAGITKDKTLIYMEKEEWDDVISTNLTSVFNMSKAVLPYMLKQRGGRIINISSVSGINGLPGQTNYSSSKAGMIGFTKALAKELASFHICVNAIAPGPVDTRLLEGLSVKMKEGLLSNVPIKRMCKTEEVAMVMNFLADEELSPEYLTGQVITLDGGMGL